MALATGGCGGHGGSGASKAFHVALLDSVAARRADLDVVAERDVARVMERIAEARRADPRKQYTVARRVGVDSKQVGCWLAGRERPGMRSAIRLAGEVGLRLVIVGAPMEECPACDGPFPMRDLVGHELPRLVNTLRRYRKWLELSRAELEEPLGLATGALLRRELDRRVASLGELARWARMLSCSLEAVEAPWPVGGVL